MRSVRLRILIPRARRLSTCISRATASFVDLTCAVAALRGRKRGHFGEKVEENDVFRYFYTTFLPKWPRLRPHSATTTQGVPTKLAVGRDMHVDRRCARGIRILSGTARARIDAPFACWNVGVFPLIRKRSSSWCCWAGSSIHSKLRFKKMHRSPRLWFS